MGADGQTARAMLRSKQAPRVGGAPTRYTAKPLTKTMRKAPDICPNVSTPLGRQTTARRARSDRGVQAAGDRFSVGNFA
jgi:hypothetical protein